MGRVLTESGDLLDEKDRYIELLADLQEIEKLFCEDAGANCIECQLYNLCVTVKRF